MDVWISFSSQWSKYTRADVTFNNKYPLVNSVSHLQTQVCVIGLLNEAEIIKSTDDLTIFDWWATNTFDVSSNLNEYQWRPNLTLHCFHLIHNLHGPFAHYDCITMFTYAFLNSRDMLQHTRIEPWLYDVS